MKKGTLHEQNEQRNIQHTDNQWMIKMIIADCHIILTKNHSEAMNKQIVTSILSMARKVKLN